MMAIQGNPRFEPPDVYNRFGRRMTERCLALVPVDAAGHTAQLCFFSNSIETLTRYPLKKKDVLFYFIPV